MKTSFPIICQTCQKTFYVYNSFYINTRPIRFCSNHCKHRRSKNNEDYFLELTPNKYHLFGQIIATSYIQDFQTIIIRSDLVTLDKINVGLESTYKFDANTEEN